jgi:hypothetical protein
MSTLDFRIARVQKTLEWLEEDMPLLNIRFKDLSAERRESARRFATAAIKRTRAELENLLRERPEDTPQPGTTPCEPAD